MKSLSLRMIFSKNRNNGVSPKNLWLLSYLRLLYFQLTWIYCITIKRYWCHFSKDNRVVFFCRSFWKVWRLYTPVDLSNRQSCNAFYCNVVVKVLATGFTFSVGANDSTDGSPIDLAPVFSDWDIWKSLYNFSTFVLLFQVISCRRKIKHKNSLLK